MIKLHRDLFILCTIAVINLIIASVPVSPQWLRVIFSLPTIFFSPGYAILAATLPVLGRSWSERLLLRIGLSIIFTSISGLILNLFQPGLQAETWAFLYAFMVIAFSMLAVYRRQYADHDTQFAQLAIQPNSSLRTRIQSWPFVGFMLLIMVILVLFIGSYALDKQAALQQTTPGFTEAWIVPGNSNAKTIDAQIGLSNHEHTAMKYSINVQENGSSVIDIPDVTLANNAAWTYLAQFPRIGSPLNIVVTIYRADRPNAVYRTVNITLDR